MRQLVDFSVCQKSVHTLSKAPIIGLERDGMVKVTEVAPGCWLVEGTGESPVEKEYDPEFELFLQEITEGLEQCG